MHIIPILAAVLNLSANGNLIWHPSYPAQGRRADGTIVRELAAQPQEVRESCGWYALADEPPQTHSNEVAVAIGYVRTPDGYRREYRIDIEPPKAVAYSVADLVWWATTHGYMARADALLGSNGVYSAAITTRVVSGDNPTFAVLWPRLCDALGLTEAERREALDYASTDAEPDAQGGE